jgi:hypothetical protein
MPSCAFFVTTVLPQMIAAKRMEAVKRLHGALHNEPSGSVSQGAMTGAQLSTIQCKFPLSASVRRRTAEIPKPFVFQN